jgi:hypothetical protein
MANLKYSPMKAFYPTADELLAADGDQLAETVLRHLKTYEGGATVHQPVGGFNRSYYVRVMEGGTGHALAPLPNKPEYGERQPEVSRRIQEAWHRLVAKGYLMQNPSQPNSDWHVITTEGEEMLSKLARFERWEKYGADAIKADLVNGGHRLVGGTASVRQLAWEWVRMKEGQAMLPATKRTGTNGTSFIAESRIEELRQLPSTEFDFQKLIRLCEELNSDYENGNYYSTAMVTRGILDHVPPIFQKASFTEVANNYSGGGRSFKAAMQHLDSASRKVSDGILHDQIRKSETLPTPQQVWCGQQLDILLAEIVRIMK